MFVKICGNTTEEDALLATALGADALGFVFAPSRRQVKADDVRSIVKRLPHEVTTIGVFVNEQLSGREPLSEVRWIRERLSLVIQGFTAGDPALALAANGPADVVLVDSPNPGSGQVFDWRLAEGAPGGVRLLLAGGLTPENVSEAIRRVRPWGVDVATGVEASPGRKDPRKLRRFIEAARGGEAALEEPVRQRPSNGRPYDWSEDLY
jgi:phosphoribosylanthranilate isomerase